jgi:hypothetical protein
VTGGICRVCNDSKLSSALNKAGGDEGFSIS